MFAYASLALGSTGGSGSKMQTPIDLSSAPSISKFLLRTRFGLGLIGIFIVLLSVCSSAGFWSLMGLKSTLIIAEVIPFLILAVGVDNIFLITNELKDVNNMNLSNDLDIHERIGKTLANIGPSILLSSTCQFFCFTLGSAVGMPAVKNFALYSAFSILFNTLLQLTCFVSVLSLDQKRIEDGRLDLIPFVKADGYSVSLPENDEDLSNLLQSNLIGYNGDESFFTVAIRDHFAPLLFSPKVRKTIISLFVAWVGISLALLPKIEMALDQRIAIPSDSYLIDYFNSVYKYLNVGPPIYFVVNDIDVTKLESQQQLCGKFTTCDEFSLVNILEQEYKRVNQSTIAEPVASWLDDFLMWTNPDLSDCCRFKKGSIEEFCDPWKPPRQCQVCFENTDWDYQMRGFPQNESFTKFFNEWIQSPSDPCPLGGKAPYYNSIYLNEEDGSIQRSVFRTAHKPLRSQYDFIDAYHNSLRVVEEIKDKHEGLDVFAYSPFYIFFVQYETIVKLTIGLIAFGLAFVFVVTAFLLGSIRNAAVLVLTVSLIMIDIGGAMALWGISLNAISLVNLMICLGLSVEFSIHLIKHFNFNGNGSNSSSLRKTSFKMNRAFNSLVFIGNSTLSGITLTKLIGIAVLSFTRSKIFQIYYFKMWLSLIIVASLHALVLLPLFLGYFGGSKSYRNSQFATFTNEDVVRRMRSSRG
ncbi:unnamed protein product [Ambrosiozyma monospora]|uniref:Unnamed protein product n=1 Tax=Ambrosiozyma monospora TaxID=43982 RepID=A0ACB5SU68_AMBMO|nr:unnamed protein product [Ambrosiozyma monospora]